MRTVIRHVNPDSALKNVSRRDTQYQVGWIAQKNIDSRSFSRFFSDKSHGSPGQALDAALDYIEELKAFQ